MKFPSSIQNLINKLTDLPSVGPKTAERYVFYLLNQPQNYLQDLSQKIADLKNNLKECQRCLVVAESDPCSICADKSRDNSMICIVENSQDLLTIELGGDYNGSYFVLGGTINTIEGIKPEHLNVKKLISRIEKEKSGLKEVILALNPTLEGETTAQYLNKLLKTYNLNITRLARGLPMGSDIEYVDKVTMANALKYRNKY